MDGKTDGVAVCLPSVRVFLGCMIGKTDGIAVCLPSVWGKPVDKAVAVYKMNPVINKIIFSRLYQREKLTLYVLFESI